MSNKTTHITICVSEQEKRQFEQLAKKSIYDNLSQYIRIHLRKQVKEVLNDERKNS